jgi:hypothetical protein
MEERSEEAGSERLGPLDYRIYYCYITVDSETVASQNGVCMTQRNVSYSINGNDLVLQLPMIKE